MDPALAFLAAGSVWFVVGTLYGLVSAIHLVAPEFFNNIPAFVFGRSRPAHVNTVIFGFVINMLIGSGLYYVPALLKTRIWSPAMAWLSFILWNLGVLSGPVSFAFGLTQGREYTEYVWWGDMGIWLATLLVLFNMIMTITRRREQFLYVAVWYFIGTFLWGAATYPIGNVMWRPGSGALSGMLDSIILWFYAHNLVGLIITPLATGAAYYVIPRVTRTPLYSHTLSLIGFWTLVAFYTHIGGHHIIQAPIPGWMQNIAVVHSMAMVVPVFAVLANLWLTIRGFGGRVLADPAGRLVLVGLIWYLVTCVQGPLQSTHALQRVTHLNNWTIGHSHIAVLGFGGFIALGGMWHVLPLIVRRRIFSMKLINLQFGLLMTGLIGFFVVLTIAGLIQGQAWYNGEVVYRTLPEMPPYMGLRAAFGISIIAASLIGLYNFLMTVVAGEPYSPEYIVNPEVGIL
ncbi:MAG TPA: cytochrome-c oxidase [Desulfobacteraceae bacterium]|nr:cytochrome-c oxidase [Desulfobacteraceae bacterium]